jgi:predicted permease
MNPLLDEIRYGVRILARNPRFTAVSAGILAVAMGANTALFGVVNSLFLKPRAGIASPGRLVDVGRTQDGSGFDTFSYPNYRDYRDENQVFSGLLAYGISQVPLSLGGDRGADRIFGTCVSGNFFEVLGVKPAWGRFFIPEEDGAPGTHPVAVISHRLWEARFGRDASALGGTVRINRMPFAVVGVAPAGFQGPGLEAPDVWIPLSMAPLIRSDPGLLESRQSVWLVGIGRLRQGASRDQAQADLSLIARRLESAYPDVNRGMGVRLLPSGRFPGEMRDIVLGFLAILMAIAGLFLLVASLNVAGMLLARAFARGKEFAVRRALGAGAGRLARQVLLETGLLFLLGGAGGFLLSLWMTDLLQALLPRLPFPVSADLAPDGRVLACSFLLPLAAGLLAGLLPARQASRTEPLLMLKSAGQGSVRGTPRMRSLFVAGQVGVSLVLLMGAGLLARSLARAAAIDPGFEPEDVQIASLDLSVAGYQGEPALRLVDDLLERLRALPGVVSASTAADLPLDGSGMGLGGIVAPGKEPADGSGSYTADANVVSPAYFQTMGVRLVEGRGFQETDREGTPRVVVVNETVARRFWPGESALGKRLLLESSPLEVVGVAADGTYRWLGEAPRLFVYVPLRQYFFHRITLLARTSGGGSPAPAIRDLLREIDPDLPLVNAQSLVDYTAASLFPLRLAAAVAGGLGIVALILAAVGIYGVLSGNVIQRSREIGVRIALGAGTAEVVRMVVRDGLRFVLPGIVLGTMASFTLTRILSGLLLQVSPLDPATFVAVPLILCGAALVACYLPARRAARLDPMALLRNE